MINNHIQNIILTRPCERADSLRSKLEQFNYRVISLPCYEVKFLMKREIQDLDLTKYQIVIFVSVNAVKGFFNNYKYSDFPATAKIMAIGSATAQELDNYKIKHVIFPRSEFEQKSEYFINLPELQDVKDKDILIVRGDTSREYILSELVNRGANIQELIVYEVAEPKSLKQDSLIKLNFLLEQNKESCSISKHTVLVITSVSILHNLVNNLSQQLLKVIRECHLIVVSSRIVTVAQQLGFVNILNSNTMQEDSIIKLINNII